MDGNWTMSELKAGLDEFERELREAGLSENTVHTYVDRAERFLRYVAGNHHPGR